ncbi:MAG: ROK family protein [Adhaeribacter sp.]
MRDQKVIGIDIGATKMHLALVQEGQILREHKFATSAQAPQQQIVSELIGGIEVLFEEGVSGIGIGVPGLVDETQGIIYDLNNIPSWQEVHLKAALEAVFKVPVLLTNDGNTFVLGEKIYGQGKAFKNLLGITLGTGFGTGIVLNNQLYSGTLSSAGEFGGAPYLDQTIEDYCSGKFFQQQYGLPGQQIAEKAQAGDAQAREAFRCYGSHLGKALHTLLYALSPEAIFLGGSVTGCYPLFADAMHQSLQTFPFKRVLQQLVIQPSTIQNAGILGAAALVEMKSEAAVSLQPSLF